ncbi:MAG TPA: DMT family transporter [Streptosporangiaceae bacterium]|nr:DMT family transporter [Streptosporangiaceae bacterium]
MTGALAQPMAIVFALAGAGCYALASVTQQQAASKLRSSTAVDPVLLLRLARAPRWLASLVAVIAGFGCQAVALSLGRLVVVEPVFPAGLLFALMLAARAEGRRLRHAEWTAAVAAIAGLAVFLVAAEPSGGHTTAPAGILAVAVGTAVGFAVTCGLLATRVTTAHRALVLSIGGGVGAGVTDAVTKTVASVAGRVNVGVFADPRLYLLAVIGLTTFTVQQNAFRAAGLAASLPAFAVLEPVTGSVLGLLIYHERVGVGPLRIAIEAVAVVAALWGIARLANSVIAVSAKLAKAAAAAATPPADPVG